MSASADPVLTLEPARRQGVKFQAPLTRRARCPYVPGGRAAHGREQLVPGGTKTPRRRAVEHHWASTPGAPCAGRTSIVRAVSRPRPISQVTAAGVRRSRPPCPGDGRKLGGSIRRERFPKALNRSHRPVLTCVNTRFHRLARRSSYARDEVVTGSTNQSRSLPRGRPAEWPTSDVRRSRCPLYVRAHTA